MDYEIFGGSSGGVHGRPSAQLGCLISSTEARDSTPLFVGLAAALAAIV